MSKRIINRTVLPVALAAMVALTGGIALNAQADHHDQEGVKHDSPEQVKGHKRGKMHKKHADMQQKFKQELNLSEEQDAEIKTIKQSFKDAHGEQMAAKRAKMKDLWQKRQSGDITPEEFKTQREALKAEYTKLHEARKAMMEQIKSDVLTPEQAEKMDAMKAKHKQKMGKMKKHRKQRSADSHTPEQ